MIWRTLLDELVTAGHLTPAATEAAAGALRDPTRNPPPVPWMVRVMVGIGAWIAGCFGLGSVLMCLGLLIDSPSSFLVTTAGLLLLATSVAVRLATPRLFLGQLALSVGAAGQLLIGGGLVDSALSIGGHALVWVVLSTALVLIHPDPVQRFVSTVVGISSLGVVFQQALPIAAGELTLAVTCALLLAVTFAPEARLPARVSAMRAPLRLGLVVSLLLTTLGGEAAAVLGELYDSAIPRFSLAPLVLGVALLVAIWRVLAAYGRGLASEPGALAIVTTVLLGALGQGRPGLLGALLALLVSFVARDKVAVGLSTAFLVGFGVHFYYDLDLSLWTKSGVLVGSGVVLLAVRAWLHHRRFLTEGA